MLSHSHKALDVLLHRQGKLPDEVDVRYEAPTKQWVESLIRPTVSFFLFDIQENKEKRETNLQTFRGQTRAERRMPPRRMDLYYSVAAFATEVTDEHEILWRVLGTLLKYQQFPDEILPEALKKLEPRLSSRFGEKEDLARLSELWTALGLPPHPALCYIVTTPLDLDVSIEAPLVLTRTARYKSPAAGNVFETAIQIGGIIKDRSGNPVSDYIVRREGSAADGCVTGSNGEFKLGGIPQGPVRLTVLKEGVVRKQVQVTVPAENYEIVLDN
jgi:hypothetical protein